MQKPAANRPDPPQPWNSPPKNSPRYEEMPRELEAKIIAEGKKPAEAH